MNFFKIKTSWSNAEFIPLKISIGTAFLLLGTYFHNFFRQYYIAILIVFAITISWTLWLWLSKMKKTKQDQS